MIERTNFAIREGVGDLVIAKSRDMGATWCMLGIVVWNWLFNKNFNAHIGSRKAELVDKFGDKSSLFERIRLILEQINRATPGIVPDWEKVSGSMKIVNPTNGSVITGEATVKSFARQGRFNLIFCDEFSKTDPVLQDEIWIGTADAAPCRVFVSTSDVVDNRFGKVVYKLKDEPQANINMLTGEMDIDNPHSVWLMQLHWTLHQGKAQDAYYLTDTGKKIPIKPEIPKAYELFLNGEKIRSPWYDSEIRRRTLDGQASSREIAQELDMEFVAAGSPVFSEKAIAYGKANSKPPIGKYVIDPAQYPKLLMKPSDRGEIHLWEKPDKLKPYGIFADCAQCLDTASDYDAFAVIDTVDMRIVATGVGRWSVNDYAKILCMISYYYNEGLLAVEANDVGLAILTIITGRIGIADKEEFKRLQRSGGMMYNRLYVDWVRDSETMQRRSRLGWRTSRVSKRAMISGLDRLMDERWIEVPDIRFWQQAAAFCNLPSGKVGAIAGNDDLVIAVAGAAAIAPEAKLYKPVPLNLKSPFQRVKDKIVDTILKGDIDSWHKSYLGYERLSIGLEVDEDVARAIRA